MVSIVRVRSIKSEVSCVEDVFSTALNRPAGQFVAWIGFFAARFSSKNSARN